MNDELDLMAGLPDAGDVAQPDPEPQTPAPAQVVLAPEVLDELEDRLAYRQSLRQNAYTPEPPAYDPPAMGDEYEHEGERRLAAKIAELEAKLASASGPNLSEFEQALNLKAQAKAELDAQFGDLPPQVLAGLKSEIDGMGTAQVAALKNGAHLTVANAEWAKLARTGQLAQTQTGVRLSATERSDPGSAPRVPNAFVEEATRLYARINGGGTPTRQWVQEMYAQHLEDN